MNSPFDHILYDTTVRSPFTVQELKAMIRSFAPLQLQKGVSMYIWHKEAKSKKFLVEHEFAFHYIAANGSTFPKLEYELCPPPESQKEWVDITKSLMIGVDPNIALYHGRELVVVRESLDVHRRLHQVAAMFASDLPVPISCFNVPVRTVLVVEEERPIQS